jgi:hypothetical protein
MLVLLPWLLPVHIVTARDRTISVDLAIGQLMLDTSFYESGLPEFVGLRWNDVGFIGPVAALHPSGRVAEFSIWSLRRLRRVRCGWYFDSDGTLQSRIECGDGWRILYHNGHQEGGEHYIDGVFDRGAA